MDDHQTLTADDAGAVPDEILAEPAPETPLEAMTRVLETLNNSKAWALVKAQGIEERITAVGGAVPVELQAVIDDIRAAAAK